ncbi:MAG: hypothetical protein N2445_01465 [Acidobacteria bacterium]|nr:hypothetical protein [Acidobacteriota bacterium]
MEIPKAFPLYEIVAVALLLSAIAIFWAIRILRKPVPAGEEEKKYANKTIEEYLISKIEEKLKKNVLSLQDYSELTEDIRMYIEEKCQIDASFMTTYELFEFLKGNYPFNAISIGETAEIFILSDLVKFAKHFPNEEEEKKFKGNLYMLQKDLREKLLKKEKAA